MREVHRKLDLLLTTTTAPLVAVLRDIANNNTLGKGTEAEDYAVVRKGADNTTWSIVKQGDNFYALSAAHCALDRQPDIPTPPPTNRSKRARTDRAAVSGTDNLAVANTKNSYLL